MSFPNATQELTGVNFVLSMTWRRWGRGNIAKRLGIWLLLCWTYLPVFWGQYVFSTRSGCNTNKYEKSSEFVPFGRLWGEYWSLFLHIVTGIVGRSPFFMKLRVNIDTKLQGSREIVPTSIHRRGMKSFTNAIYSAASLQIRVNPSRTPPIILERLASVHRCDTSVIISIGQLQPSKNTSLESQRFLCQQPIAARRFWRLIIFRSIVAF